MNVRTLSHQPQTVAPISTEVPVHRQLRQPLSNSGIRSTGSLVEQVRSGCAASGQFAPGTPLPSVWDPRPEHTASTTIPEAPPC